MSRPVLSLRLPAAAHTRLLRAGFREAADADADAALAPPPELGPSALLPPARTAAELARQLREQPHVATGLPALDALLGARGLPTAAVSELVAHPAAAAALCLRLCLATQLPPPAQQPGRPAAVYVDTAGAFSARAAACAASAIARQLPPAARPDPAAMLARIHVFRAYAAHELIALLASLDRVLRSRPDVGLLLVNSVSWPFLASFPDDVLRRQAMHAEAARLLAALASRHRIAA
ncbi:hypothetical protein LPJ61_003886, partial [Coemansia biformis]